MTNDTVKNSIIQYQDSISKVEKYKRTQSKMIARFSFDKKIQKRFTDCADVLFFNEYEHKKTFERTTKLSKSYMCENRFCDVCNYYRSRNTGTAIYNHMINLNQQGKEFIFMTLTVENCLPSELNATIKKMAKAWGKFSRIKQFKNAFSHWFRVLEITANTDGDIATLHPHYHIILAVEPTYFTSKDYYKTSDIVKLWTNYLGQKQQAICDIRKVKANARKGKNSLLASVSELSKYAVKTAELKNLSDKDFETVFKSLKNVRFLTTSRNIKLNEGADDNEKIDEDIWQLLFTQIYKFSTKTEKYHPLKMLVKAKPKRPEYQVLKNVKVYKNADGDVVQESTDYRNNEYKKIITIDQKEQKNE